MEKPLFLATTALEEFWDTSRPIIFLGEWCRRYSRKRIWESLNANVLPSIWEDRRKFNEAYQYVNDVYELFLPRLGEALNDIHNKKYSDKYWRIVAGPWLFQYIHAIYDRYVHLYAAIDKYPNLQTIGLKEDFFIVPKDSSHYSDLISDDLYNLQIYTRILAALGISFPRKAIIFDKKTLSVPIRYDFKRLALKCLNGFYRIFNQRASVVIVNAYFPHYGQLKLFLKIGGKIIPVSKEKIKMPESRLSDSARLRCRDLNIKEGNFENLLQKMLPYDMPQSLVENYDFIEKRVNKEYPKNPSAILSCVMWHHHDDFKQWAAAASERGAQLICMQHGGNYGSVSQMQMLSHEIAISDRFYSWGWTDNSLDSHVVPMPASMLVGRKIIGASNEKKGVLFTALATSRYLGRIGNIAPCNYSDHLQWQYRFVMALLPRIRNSTRIRLNENDYGWDVKDRWMNSEYSNIKIENWDHSFAESLQDSRIYVTDHLSTTFVEALSSSKPTVLFWDHNIYELTNNSMSYYEDLYSTGILHGNPESAASMINSAYDDVENWWNDSQRRRAVENFCNCFAKTSPNAIHEWAAELKRVAAH